MTRHKARGVFQMLTRGSLGSRFRVALAIDDTVLHTISAYSVSPASVPPPSLTSSAPQSIVDAFERPGDALGALYCAYHEAVENGLLRCSSGTAFYSAADEMIEGISDTEGKQYWIGFTVSERTLFYWTMMAYSMAFADASFVRIRPTPRGPDRIHSFGIFANKELSPGTWIWDLGGLIPESSLASRMSDSQVTLIGWENLEDLVSERWVFGPLRLVSHRCRMYNCEFAVDDTTYFYEHTRSVVLRATTNIARGDELTVNWGSGWFGSSCQCLDCAIPGPLLTAAPPTLNTAPPPVHASIQRRGELLAKLRSAVESLNGRDGVELRTV